MFHSHCSNRKWCFWNINLWQFVTFNFFWISWSLKDTQKKCHIRNKCLAFQMRGLQRFEKVHFSHKKRLRTELWVVCWTMIYHYPTLTAKYFDKHRSFCIQCNLTHNIIRTDPWNNTLKTNKCEWGKCSFFAPAIKLILKCFYPPNQTWQEALSFTK